LGKIAEKNALLQTFFGDFAHWEEIRELIANTHFF